MVYSAAVMFQADDKLNKDGSSDRDSSKSRPAVAEGRNQWAAADNIIYGENPVAAHKHSRD